MIRWNHFILFDVYLEIIQCIFILILYLKQHCLWTCIHSKVRYFAKYTSKNNIQVKKYIKYYTYIMHRLTFLPTHLLIMTVNMSTYIYLSQLWYNNIVHYSELHILLARLESASQNWPHLITAYAAHWIMFGNTLQYLKTGNFVSNTISKQLQLHF